MIDDFYRKGDIEGAGQALGLSGIEKGMAKAGLQASQFGDVLEDVDDIMDIMSNTSLKGTKGLKAIGQGFLNVGKKVKTFLTPLNIVKGLGIGALIGGAGYAIKKSYDSLPSTKAKQLNEMTEEYATNEDKLASLNTELADTQARIEELSLKGHLSLVEEDELSKLKETNAELERSISLQESQNKVDARETLNKAKDTYKSYTTEDYDGLLGDKFANALGKETDKSYNKGKIAEESKKFVDMYGNADRIAKIRENANRAAWDIWDSYEGASLDSIDPKNNADNINYLAGAYDGLLESQKKVKQENDLLQKSFDDEKDSDKQEKIQNEMNALNEYSGKIDSKLAEVQGYINDYIGTIEKTYQAYKTGEDLGILTQSEQTELKDLEATMVQYDDILNKSGKTTESNIATMFAKQEYADLKEEMIAAGKEGSDSLDALIAKNKNFTDDLSEVGVTTDDLKQHIMAMADPDSYNIDKLKGVLEKKFFGEGIRSQSKQKEWDKFISGKSDENLQMFYDYIRDNDLDPSKWNYDDLEYNMEIAINGEEEVKSAALTIDQLNEKVGKYQSNLSAVSSAMSETGTNTGLTSESIQGLNDAFGTLENYDPSGLFINTAKGVKINDRALKRLVKTQHEAATSDLDKRIAKQTEELKKQQDILNSDESNAGQLKAAEENFKKAQENIENMKRAQAQMSAIYNEQMKQFSDFQNIQNSKNTPNAGDEYTSVMQDIKSAKEAWDKGFIGTDDFKSVAKYLSPYGFEDPVNFKENYDRISGYFTEDGSGVLKFYDDMEKRGLATLRTLEDGTQEWVTNFSDAEEAALQMGMGFEPFMAVLGRAEDMGAFNSFASSAEEASQNVEDVSSKLADVITKKAELEAEGAPQSAIEAQQAEIDKYTSQLDEVKQTEDEWTTNIGAKRAKEIQNAKKEIETLGKEIERLNKEGDIETAEKLKDEIKSKSAEYGLEYNEDDYTVSDESYTKALQSTGAATWEIPKTAKEMGFAEGSEDAKNYENALSALTKAHEENGEATQGALNALSSYNAEQLKGIELGDGAYNVEGMEAAEDALEDLAKATGLTRDELLLALEGVGILKPEVDTTDLDELDEKAKSSQEKLNEMNGTKYEIDIDTKDPEKIEQQVKNATEQIQPYLSTNEDGTPKYDYSKEGAQEAHDVYASAIAHQQRAEYENSEAYQTEASTPLAEATKNFLEAKAEYDTQADLAAKGMKNNMEEAQKQAEATFETFKKADTEGVFDTSGLDNLEKDILDDTSEEYKIKVDADTSEAQSEIDKVKQEEITQKIKTVIENEGGDDAKVVNELLAMSDQKLMTTVGCDASEVETVREQLEAMDQQNVQFAVEIDNTQFNALIEAITGEPVTQEVEVEATGETSILDEIEKLPMNKEVVVETVMTGNTAILEEFGVSEVQKSIIFHTGGDMDQINQIAQYLNSIPESVVVKMIQEGMTLDDIILAAQNQTIEVPVTYSDPEDIPDPENPVTVPVVYDDPKDIAQPVNLTANVTSVNTPPQQSIDAIANITDTQGEDGQEVNVDATANITDTKGADGQQVVVDATANVSGVNDSSASVSANVDGTAEVAALQAAITNLSGKIVIAKANVKGTDEVRELKSAIDSLNGKIVSVGASVSGTGAVNALSASINSLHDKSVTITTTHISRSEKASATGTATSIAHADGTAYNVLNMRPLSSAHAKGDISLNNDEKALVNEVGVESIVRDGVWSLIPGGAHFENLKKGDIIFSAAQTKALLEHGKIAGHARAFAQGSLGDYGSIPVLPAHYTPGGSSFRPQGGISGNKPSSNNSTHSNTTSYNNNTGAVNSNTKATNDNTKAAKKSTQVFDWVERRLKYFADKTKAIADSINDYISSSQKKSLLQKQIYATNSEMHVNYRSARAYYSKAQSLGLSSKTRKLIEEGRYTLDDIDTSTESGKAHYDKVQKYMNYYDEYTKCIDAVRELRNEQVELYAQWAAIPTEEAEKKIDKLTQSYNGLAAIQARLETAGMGGSAQALLMTQLDNTMRYANNNKKKTDAEWNKQNNRLSAAQTKEDTAKGKASEDKKALNTAKKNLTKKQKGVSLTSEEKKRVSSGQALSTKGLKGKKKQLVQEYNAALKKSQSSDKAYKSAQSYTKKVQNSDEYKNAKDAKHTNDVIYLEYKKNWEAAKKAYDKGDSLSYQNYLVDQELALLKQQNDAKNTAYRKANRNTQTATKRKNSYKSKLDSVKKKGKSYSKKYAKYLTAEQEKQLAAGKKINTDNIKNANVKKIIDQYNIDLQNAMNSYTAATQQLTAAQEAEAEAAANAAQSQAEYAQAQVEAEKTKFDNIKKYYEQRIEYQESWNKLYDKQREYDKTHGDYTTSESFDKPINEINKAQRHQEEAAKKLQEQLNKAVKAGTIKEYSDEWLEMKSEIVDAQTAVQDYENQMEQLKQEQILVQYEEMFDRAIEKAEKFKDKIEAINSLITEDMMYDYETGHLTEFGALSIVLNAKQLDTSLTTLKDYVKKRQQIMDDFKADKFGEETYDKLMAENDASLQGALKDAQAYQQAIIGIIKDQAQAEQDALFKVIDARKDALQKKKDYYDYDKTIKNKSKEINLLKQQIAALDGVTDAQSRAEKARLEAELAEKQEDFDDTVRDHVYELQVDGLDDLKDQLSEDFEKWSHELSANLDKMSQAIADAVANVGGNTADALNSIAKILEQFGINAGDMGITQGDLNVSDMSKYRKGKLVGEDVLAVTNDRGCEIVITKQGIKSNDGVIPNNITPNNMNEILEDMAAFWRNPNFPTYEDMFRMKATESNTRNNVTFNYGGSMVNVEVQGDLTKSTLPDLQTICKEASKYTQNEMRKNLKRFG